MGCTKSKGKSKPRRSNSNVSETSEAPYPTGGAAGGAVAEARGNYVLSAGLAADELANVNDDPNAPIVERGPIQLENGLIYTGQMQGRKKHGKGKQVWPDGAEFIGEWKHNVACGRASGKALFLCTGKGIFKHADGDVYEGEWLNDKANGYGVLKHQDGSTYEGDWKDDLNHGHGKETWADGSHFEGNYEMGRKEGRGIFEWPDKSKYNGEFHDNEIDGWGRYDWPDGRVYCGQWSDNKMHGFGWFFWPNQQIYKGQYDMDKKDGWGEFFWPDKKGYRGWWKAGKQNGLGTFRSPKGEEKIGVWQAGSRTCWLNSEEEIVAYRTANNVPPDPELPKLPDWLEELCMSAYPAWWFKDADIAANHEA